MSEEIILFLLLFNGTGGGGGGDVDEEDECIKKLVGGPVTAAACLVASCVARRTLDVVEDADVWWWFIFWWFCLFGLPNLRVGCVTWSRLDILLKNDTGLCEWIEVECNVRVDALSCLVDDVVFVLDVDDDCPIKYLITKIKIK